MIKLIRNFLFHKYFHKYFHKFPPNSQTNDVINNDKFGNQN